MNENPNNESNLSSASNEKINLKHHKANSSLLAKENKDKEEENDEKEKPKLKNSVVKKTKILGDSIIKNVDHWRLNRRMKPIVLIYSISGAITKAMTHHVIGCLQDKFPDTILLHQG